MRISDWSSDVCSSDLQTAFIVTHRLINGAIIVETCAQSQRRDIGLDELLYGAWINRTWEGCLGFELPFEIGAGSTLGKQRLLNFVRRTVKCKMPTQVVESSTARRRGKEGVSTVRSQE